MKIFSTCLLAIAMLLATGCVAQREADDLRALYRKSQGQIIDLQAQLEEKDAQIAALRGGGGDELARVTAERDRLREALDNAERMLREMGAGPLTPELSSALEELAGMYPDLMVYDPARGMVQLRSDLTFALGSAEVRQQASTAINRLAAVLKTDAAAPYEIRLVGHTDNVPVRNPANVQKYGDNWGLSAARAISVMRVFQQAGIAPDRMMVAGRGEYDPVVANGPKGAEANRRVEIYLVAAHPAQPSDSTAPAASSSSQPAAEPPAPTPAEPTDVYEEPAMYK